MWSRSSTLPCRSSKICFRLRPLSCWLNDERSSRSSSCKVDGTRGSRTRARLGGAAWTCTQRHTLLSAPGDAPCPRAARRSRFAAARSCASAHRSARRCPAARRQAGMSRAGRRGRARHPNAARKHTRHAHLEQMLELVEAVIHKHGECGIQRARQRLARDLGADLDRLRASATRGRAARLARPTLRADRHGPVRHCAREGGGAHKRGSPRATWGRGGLGCGEGFCRALRDPPSGPSHLGFLEC